jgi:hypothetical protein
MAGSKWGRTRDILVWQRRGGILVRGEELARFVDDQVVQFGTQRGAFGPIIRHVPSYCDVVAMSAAWSLCAIARTTRTYRAMKLVVIIAVATIASPLRGDQKISLWDPIDISSRPERQT